MPVAPRRRNPVFCVESRRSRMRGDGEFFRARVSIERHALALHDGSPARRIGLEAGHDHARNRTLISRMCAGTRARHATRESLRRSHPRARPPDAMNIVLGRSEDRNDTCATRRCDAVGRAMSVATSTVTSTVLESARARVRAPGCCRDRDSVIRRVRAARSLSAPSWFV